VLARAGPFGAGDGVDLRAIGIDAVAGRPGSRGATSNAVIGRWEGLGLVVLKGAFMAASGR
jgi:hypothetical protein